MRRSSLRRSQAIKDLGQLLAELPRLVEVVLVEGLRDVQAIRSLGYAGELAVLNRAGVNDYDLVGEIASSFGSVLVLSDFDEEGVKLNQLFTSLFEKRAVNVEIGLRKEVGSLTAAIGVYAIEDLDNIRERFTD